MASDDTNLYWYQVDPNLIYVLEPDDGTVIDSFSPPSNQASGGLALAFNGTNLFSTDDSFVVNDATIFEIPVTGSGIPLNSFPNYCFNEIYLTLINFQQIILSQTL